MRELTESYEKNKLKIKARLQDFKNLKEDKYFDELRFCLLTPQSNAKKCWSAIEELNKQNPKTQSEIAKILQSRTRFHNNKSRYLIRAEETFKQIRPHLSNKNRIELRNLIADKVKGYGLKEAGHFLRNIGKSDDQIAILDRHILRNLKSLGIINQEKIKNKEDYLAIEKKFIQFSKQIQIPIDELDLLFWSKENGEIFK